MYALIPKQQFNSVSTSILNRLLTFDQFVFSIYQSRYGSIFVFLIPAFIFFYPAITNSFPVGYSGLYTLMSEKLLENHFIPPESVPFYSQGNVPFVYPPLGFYFAALAMIFDISIFDYLRFIPPFLGLLSLFSLYLLILELTQRRSKAILTVLFVSTSYEFFEKQATAAGMVRSWALLFSLLSIYLFLKVIKNQGKDKILIGLTGLCLGLTALSHFLYLLFTLIMICLLCLFKYPRTNYKYALFIFSGGFIIFLPWFILSLLRIGPLAFLDTFQSHNNSLILTLIKQPFSAALMSILFMFMPWIGTSFIGLAILGMITALWKRNWVPVLAIIIIFLFLGDSERFIVLLTALLLAELFLDVLDGYRLKKNKTLPFCLIALSIFILFVNLFAYQFPGQWTVSSLNVSTIETASWFKQNTPSESSYMFFSKDHNISEWMPYLSKRTTLTGHWGSEWKMRYEIDLSMWEEIGNCADLEVNSCMNLINTYHLNPDYLITQREQDKLNAEITASNQWKSVYKNENYLIYARK